MVIIIMIMVIIMLNNTHANTSTNHYNDYNTSDKHGDIDNDKSRKCCLKQCLCATSVK